MSSESYFKVPKEKDFLKIIEDAEDAGVLDKAATAVNNPLSWLRFIPGLGANIRQAEKQAKEEGKQNPLFEKGYSTVGDWHSSGAENTNTKGRSTRFGGLSEECGIHLNT